MSARNEPRIAPFRIIADSREATDGWRFEGLYDGIQPARKVIVPMDYRSLDVADYMVDGTRLYFVRRNAEQYAAAIRQRPVCVMQELKQLCELAASGASCIVVIEGATDEVEQLLADAQYFTNGSRGIVWLFAPSRHAAELLVYAVIQRAWKQLQAG